MWMRDNALPIGLGVTTALQLLGYATQLSPIVSTAGGIGVGWAVYLVLLFRHPDKPKG